MLTTESYDLFLFARGCVAQYKWFKDKTRLDYVSITCKLVQVKEIYKQASQEGTDLCETLAKSPLLNA